MTARKWPGRAWRWGRLVLAAGVLALLAWRVGAGAFLTGLRRVDAPAVVAAVALNAVATVGCAWRWRAVAAALGAELSMPAAVAAYYRALFLNVTLPGGVLGDVHRGVRHGRDVDDVPRGLRAVAWERGLGQAVQVGAVAVVLAVFPSPMRAALPYVLLAAVVVTVLVGAVWASLRVATFRWTTAARQDARALLTHRVWRPVVISSLVAVAAHATTFVVAARTAGAGASLATLLPLAAVLLLASSVPINVGGWGPREGVAAWGFAAAGMTAAQGVAAATVYGVLVLAASLPGAAVLIVARRRATAPVGAKRLDAALDDAVPPRIPVGSVRG